MRFDFETGILFGETLERIRGSEQRIDRLEGEMSSLGKRLSAIEAWSWRLALLAALASAGLATNWAPDELAAALAPLLKSLLKAAL